jgi:hypothetical protein
MAEASLVIKEPTILLELTREEAKWLKGIMQNPIYTDNDPSLIQEYHITSDMRGRIFPVLHELGEL